MWVGMGGEGWKGKAEGKDDVVAVNAKLKGKAFLWLIC